MNSTADTRPRSSLTPLGHLMKEWREARRMSQLQLALLMDVSARHLSYVETGKSRPSREFVAQLADTFEMPLRERNALMLAAGYAPVFSESELSAPEMAALRRAAEAILEQQEPFPAFVANRYWDILMVNGAMQRFMGALKPEGPRHANVLLQIFDPEDMRPFIANWTELAADILRHLHHEIARAPMDARARSLLGRVLQFPNVPQHWRKRDLNVSPTPVIPTVFRTPVGDLTFFSTLTTFASSRTVAAEETRIECMHPMDEAARQFCEGLR